MKDSLTNLEKQTCPRCGSSHFVTHDREFSNGTHHIEQRCANGHFIKFLPQGRPINAMPFGKHKGRLIRELPDPYLTWVLENLELKGGLFCALSEEFERRGVAA